MANTWLRPIADYWGGYLSTTQMGGVTAKHTENRYLHTGFCCLRTAFAPGVGPRYECTTYDSFLRFNTADLLGKTVTSCLLYLYVDDRTRHYIEGTDSLASITVDVYGRSSENTKYPWGVIDVPSLTGWSKITSVATISTLTHHTYALEELGQTGFWVSVDVTTALQAAITAGWTVFGLRLSPSDETPPFWDYNVAQPRNEECYAVFYGSRAQDTTTVLPGTYGADTSGSYALKTPWIKVVTSTTPTTTTSGVQCVCADAKAMLALAGTASGNLWKIRYASDAWQKDLIHSVDFPISCIYIDKKKNYKDYPNEATVWFGGTDDGFAMVYKAVEAAKTWSLLAHKAGTLVEIDGSELNSNWVAYAVDKTVYTSTDGVSFSVSKTTTNNILGLQVRSNEIEIVCANGEAYRNPGSNKFGDPKDWYAATDLPSDTRDIAFSMKEFGFGSTKYRQSMVLTDNNIYIYDSGTSGYKYKIGAAITGTGVVIDTDTAHNLGFIGTGTKLYLTETWGETVRDISPSGSPIDVTDISIGVNPLYEP